MVWQAVPKYQTKEALEEVAWQPVSKNQPIGA
jgi:hypothetical protein